MAFQLNTYAILVFLSAIVAGIVTFSIFRRRPAAGATSLSLLMLAVTIWSGTYALELASLSKSTMRFWLRLEYLGIATLPAFWFLFVLHYTGREAWLKRRNLVLLFVIPCLTMILNWTNEWHGLYYKSLELDMSGPFPMLSLTKGVWYWVNVGYFYLLLAIGTVLFLQTFLKAPGLYRVQSGIILLGSLAPWIGNIAYHFGFFPHANFDITPLTVTITGIVLTWGLFRFRLLDIVPVARDNVVENLADGVIVVDAQARIVDINPAAQNFIGVSALEILGQPLDNVVKDFPNMPANSSHLRDRSTQLIIKKQGITRYYDVHISQLHNRRGRVTGHVIVLHDTTESKRVEAELRQAKDVALEAKEAAEEARITAEAAQRASEAANQAKSIFLANMSHELRTPLNTILGFTQFIARNPSIPREDQEYLTIIQRSGTYLLMLINQVLDLSKIEAGKITLNEKDVDLYHMLNDLEDTFAVRAQAKDLQLRFERDDTVPQYVRTDEVKLRQVLINLLNNAIKFTEKGSVELRIANCESRNDQSEIRNLKFEIADTGSGIAPDEMEMLFEAFAQTETGRQLQEGTGLGLSISQKFVQLLGGNIQVKSQVGKGTTFTFNIRVTLVDQAVFVAQHAAYSKRPIALEPNQRAADGAPIGDGRYRILIVDDHPHNRRMLVKLLSLSDPQSDSSSTDFGTGFDLREARNGMEAVDIWKEWQPHLIWMDLRMPGMDGYEATERIRKIEEQKLRTTEEQQNRRSEINNHQPSISNQQSAPRTVIIMLSASSFEDERETALVRGCDDFLRKPFHETDLFELMRTHLGVRFVYEEEQGTGNREQGTGSREQGIDRKVIMSEALAVLPEELRKNLHEAGDMLDTDRISNLLDQVRQHNESLAESLGELVKEYRFDLLQELFEK